MYCKILYISHSQILEIMYIPVHYIRLIVSVRTMYILQFTPYTKKLRALDRSTIHKQSEKPWVCYLVLSNKDSLLLATLRYLFLQFLLHMSETSWL